MAENVAPYTVEALSVSRCSQRCCQNFKGSQIIVFVHAQLKYALRPECFQISKIWRVHSDVNISQFTV